MEFWNNFYKWRKQIKHNGTTTKKHKYSFSIYRQVKNKNLFKYFLCWTHGYSNLSFRNLQFDIEMWYVHFEFVFIYSWIIYFYLSFVILDINKCLCLNLHVWIGIICYHIKVIFKCKKNVLESRCIYIKINKS